ncbi:MAG: hypothetical protein WBB85_15625 [Albidovulum sp.]|uniref:hypothetical protein n=1 Tax=Albidovulum sp. TaxID=1872424 RepID=UPI003CBECDC8
MAAKSSEPFTRVKKMIRSMSVFALVSGLGFISIATPLHAEGIQDVLSGKTLTSAKGKTVYVLGQDGVLGGKIAKHKVVGIWEVRDGQWCRTISEPKDREGDACREVAIDGENVTLTGDGQSIMYTMK